MNELSKFFLLFTLILTTSGCSGGKPLYPVTGKAFLNGKPMVGADVFFHLVGDTDLNTPKPAAKVQEDGSFELITEGKTGAPEGTYKVTFFWAGPPKEPKQTQPKVSMGGLGGDAEGPGKSVLKPEYQYPDKATIEVTITSDTRELEKFDLK